MKKSVAYAAVLLACVVLVGCGDDDKSKDSSDDKSSAAADGALTKEELIEQGDAICAASNPVTDRLGENFADPENPTDEEIAAAVNDVLLPEIEGQLAKLKELEPPVADEPVITGMLGALEIAITDLRDDPLLIKSDPFADANELAETYGFKECGQA